MRIVRHLGAAALAALAGCGPSYSPNTYSSTAVQQAAKVERGTIVGVRPVDISTQGGVGTVTGAAAGGIAGAQVGSGVESALSALGGSIVGGIVGTGADKTIRDTTAWEYIVQNAKGELTSVTQKDEKPLTIGMKVLVISGKEARIVADYTVEPPTRAPAPAPTTTAPPPPAVEAAPLAAPTPLSPPP